VTDWRSFREAHYVDEPKFRSGGKKKGPVKISKNKTVTLVFDLNASSKLVANISDQSVDLMLTTGKSGEVGTTILTADFKKVVDALRQGIIEVMPAQAPVIQAPDYCWEEGNRG